LCMMRQKMPLLDSLKMRSGERLVALRAGRTGLSVRENLVHLPFKTS